jgi:single-stranded-DNA-specific exonuclease
VSRQFQRRVPADAVLPPDLHPVLTRLYAARHVRSAAELDQSLERLLPPDGLKGMDVATELLADALYRQRRILIVADFDADGATSCAVAVRALRALGAQSLHYVVPNRFEYGYGLTPEIVAVAAEWQPELLITVDNGISSIEGVAAAQRAGMRVLITDHHLPGATLPPADAIVNQNQPGDDFSSKSLAGVGVIFYVMLALRAKLRARGWFVQQGLAEPNLARLLDLVALGTVADVVPLDHNNRILVAQGLKRINQGQGCAGLQALLSVAGRRPGRLGAADLGFAVAPRLNAAGRLTDMSLGIECLLTDDPARAQMIAGQLDALNRERRAIESGMQAQALAAIGDLHLDGVLPHALCLFDESWHQGVIGILAARIRERVHRPVIAFAPANDVELKGSARSVPGLHVRDALDAVAARHPGLVTKFGGHAMAAGLSLPRAHLDAFRAAFAAEAAQHLSDNELAGQVITDGELAAHELTVELAELVRHAGPWGQGFPEPLFEGVFDVAERRVVGERHLKLRLRMAGRPVEAIAFGQAPAGEPPDWNRVRVAYRLDVNEFQGRHELQLVIEYLEGIGDGRPVI